MTGVEIFLCAVSVANFAGLIVVGRLAREACDAVECDDTIDNDALLTVLEANHDTTYDKLRDIHSELVVAVARLPKTRGKGAKAEPELPVVIVVGDEVA